MEYLRKLTEPEFYYQEFDQGPGRHNTYIRVYYLDGTSQYIELNSYTDDELIIPYNCEWNDSYGYEWHPDDLRRSICGDLSIRVG